MKIVIAPDSFKGSLTALQVARIIKEELIKEIPDVQVEMNPMADGGEGTLETLVFATKGERIPIVSSGPFMEQVSTEFGILGDGKTVVIEIAAISGLPMVPIEKRDPLYTSTYGIGEVILNVAKDGYREFIICLGGSSTNDGGLGMLQALGVQFLDENNEEVPPLGESIFKVNKVNFATLNPIIHDCRFTIASDVDSPLCGKNGATYIFGPQKGVKEEYMKAYDQAMHRYARLIENHLDIDVQKNRGAGAAGGLGFAFLLLNTKIESGSRLIAEVTNLKNKMKDANFIITGEGQSDFQTMFGKVPSFVAKLANEADVKIILLSGSLGKGYEGLYDHFMSCHSITTGPMTLEECMENAETLLANEARNITRFLKVISEEGAKQVTADHIQRSVRSPTEVFGV
ncbi:glycerate kinase [Metabacillus halosaccharovorans]|uniref:glycerate kinase n=1 Tax=Metabacillus halosaccharovorans TaxID=930124 RepID=UPI001C1F7F85|nr:glycerate kinase [Metabacillus halosaccharovorans]MBU7595759.1 glycerate kinase [Metabacillus halosaccharovorans]